MVLIALRLGLFLRSKNGAMRFAQGLELVEVFVEMGKFYDNAARNMAHVAHSDNDLKDIAQNLVRGRI